MRRLTALVLIAMLLSWSLTYPSVARADDTASKFATKDANQARGGNL
jgi:hypothetical protein